MLQVGSRTGDRRRLLNTDLQKLHLLFKWSGLNIQSSCVALPARLPGGEQGGDKFHVRVVQSLELMSFHTDLNSCCGLYVRYVLRRTWRLAANVAVNKKPVRLRPPVSNHHEATGSEKTPSDALLHGNIQPLYIHIYSVV